MDDDCGVDTPDDFDAALLLLFNTKQKVSLIVDNNGWEKTEGLIRQLDTQRLVLEGGAIIDIAAIVAVNGIFKRGCTCC